MEFDSSLWFTNKRRNYYKGGLCYEKITQLSESGKLFEQNF